jgi:uncharacterized protein (TIGR01244 family)
MIDRVEINERLSVGKEHPDAGDLEDLARAGFRSIANLRTRGEDEQPLAPDEEGRVAERLGMAYLHYPVAGGDLDAAVVDAFRAELDALPRPLFAHCASGKRSGAFLMMHVASETGMTGNETLEHARSMGFACDTPELETFVRTYVDDHRKPAG